MALPADDVAVVVSLTPNISAFSNGCMLLCGGGGGGGKSCVESSLGCDLCDLPYSPPDQHHSATEEKMVPL